MERRWQLLAGVSCAAALWASVVQAEQTPRSGDTGTGLLDACEARDVAQHAYCLGYIGGIADVVLTRGLRSPITVCIPSSVTNAQILDITVEYLHDHPREVRSYSGAVLVLEALRKTFRCR